MVDHIFSLLAFSLSPRECHRVDDRGRHAQGAGDDAWSPERRAYFRCPAYGAGHGPRFFRDFFFTPVLSRDVAYGRVSHFSILGLQESSGSTPHRALLIVIHKEAPYSRSPIFHERRLQGWAIELFAGVDLGRPWPVRSIIPTTAAFIMPPGQITGGRSTLLRPNAAIRRSLGS